MAIVYWLIALYLRLVYVTTRWEVRGFAPVDTALTAKKPVILAFWHGRMAMMPFFAPHPEDIYVMISKHRDGELIARVMQGLKLGLVRGSSNRPASDPKGAKDRGGAEALREALKLLKAGHTLVITPDGPKGPRMRVQQGVARLAQKSGVPVYTLAFATRFGKNWHSWDRFLFPLPFGRGYLVCGEAVEVGKGDDMEKAGLAIENQLNSITQEADRLVGRTPIEPEGTAG